MPSDIFYREAYFSFSDMSTKACATLASRSRHDELQTLILAAPLMTDDARFGATDALPAKTIKRLPPAGHGAPYSYVIPLRPAPAAGSRPPMLCLIFRFAEAMPAFTGWAARAGITRWRRGLRPAARVRHLFLPMEPGLFTQQDSP